MRKLRVQLNHLKQQAGLINFRSKDEMVLLELYLYPKNKTLYYILSNETGNLSSKSVTGELFTRINRSIYETLKIESYIYEKQSANGYVYYGTWAEILIIDIAFNLNFLYQDAHPTKTEFQIGSNDTVNLCVKTDEKGNYELMHSYPLVKKVKVLAKTKLAAGIQMLYGRIKLNLNDSPFKDRQK